jgi:glycosyltransferase involved in cell wall biosynthesis
MTLPGGAFPLTGPERAHTCPMPVREGSAPTFSVGHTPRLSIVVPCYNVEAYAANTLISLSRNRHPDLEFILVDDASTDSTPSVLAEGADRLGRVTVLTHRSNAGLAGARNTGLDAAAGEYVAFLDGDDWVEPDYYPRLLATIERLGCEMLRTDHVKVSGRKRTLYRITHGPRGVVMSPRSAILPTDRLTSVDAPWAWAGVYHRRLADDGLLRFSDRLRTAEDRPWIWRLHLHARSFAVVGMIGIFYRQGVANSLTQVGDERQLDFIDAFEQIFAELSDDPDAARFMPKAMRSYCSIINHHLSRRDRLTPTLSRHLVQRSRASLARLPAREVRAAVSGMDETRQRRLRVVLPG